MQTNRHSVTHMIYYLHIHPVFIAETY